MFSMPENSNPNVATWKVDLYPVSLMKAMTANVPVHFVTSQIVLPFVSQFEHIDLCIYQRFLRKLILPYCRKLLGNFSVDLKIFSTDIDIFLLVFLLADEIVDENLGK